MSKVQRTITSLLEGDKGSQVRSETATVYTSSDDRTYVVAILDSCKIEGVHYQEEAVAIFGTEDYLKTVEINDKIAMDAPES